MIEKIRSLVWKDEDKAKQYELAQNSSTYVLVLHINTRTNIWYIGRYPSFFIVTMLWQ